MRTQQALINHPPSGCGVRLPLWGSVAGASLPFVSRAEYRLEGLLLRRGSLDLPFALPRPSSLLPDQGRTPQWSWEGGEEAGRSPAEAAAARRGRGGAAPPPLSPNRVTGGTETRFPFARRVWSQLSRIEAAHHSPRAAWPGGIAAPGPSTPGTRRPGPTARPRAPPTHHPAGPRGTSAPRRAPAAPGSGSARAAAPPRVPTRHPPRSATSRRWVWQSRSCYPGDRGRKTAPAARPARGGALPPGTRRQSRVGRALPLPSPRPPGRPSPPAAQAGPEAAGRAGRAAPSRRIPRIPALRLCTCRGRGDSTPRSLGGGRWGQGEGKGCTPAVARATRILAAGGARAGQAAGPAAPPGPIPAGPHLTRLAGARVEPSGTGRGPDRRGLGAGVALCTPTCGGASPGPPPACLPAPGGIPSPLPRQPPPHLQGAPSSSYTCPVPGSSAILL